MYNIIRESITAPKQLIKYHSKKGWFVFLYILIFSILLSLNVYLLLIANDNPTVNNATTNCVVEDGIFLCDETPIEDQYYSAYGVNIFFLSSNQQIDDVEVESLDYAFVVKENTAHYVFGDRTFFEMDVTQFDSVGDFYGTIKSSIAVSLILFSLLQNLTIILFIVLISTLPFLRFRKEIRYRKIFKMIVFAATPIYIILTINNLLNFGTLIFFAVMFLAYRSIFMLQKELYVRSLIRKQRQNQRQNKPSSKPSINPDDIIDQEDEDKDE
ncbi:MAG TPA: DUF1189 family protein [Candidatus Izemoplasmatales bacterium]|nr:DUF1189 family protein [Candidatus Izemoplasmatales bacterium]